MATLSRPTLKIDVLTGERSHRVTATVNVQLTRAEEALINPGGGRPGIPVNLKSNLWGDDGGLTGADDNLFLFPLQRITRSGTYTFTANVSRSVLNEDSGLFNDDEIYNRFSLVSGSSIFPINAIAINSPTIKGQFG